MIYYLNATENEIELVKSILQYLQIKYPQMYDYSRLKKIKIVDSLENNSSARTIDNTIIISRKNGIEGIIYYDKVNIEHRIIEDKVFHRLVSTIFHELWHVNTWDKYVDIYNFILSSEKDIVQRLAYRYWIEYISHIDTVFLEEKTYMDNFCNHFIKYNWHKKEYGYLNMIIELPYFLVRAKYLKIYDILMERIAWRDLYIFINNINVESERLYISQEDEEIKINTIYYLFKDLFSY